MAMSQGLGKIHYKIRYDNDTSCLNVKVVECSDLKKMSFFRKSDPYVRVFLLPGSHEIVKTEIIKDSLNPVFDENFIFPVREAFNKNKIKNLLGPID